MSSLQLRIITALVLASVFLSVLLLAPLPGVIVFISLAVVVAAWEWGGFLNAGMPARCGFLVLFVVLMAVLWSFSGIVESLPAVTLVAAAWWLIALLSLFFLKGKIALPLIVIAGLCVLLPVWVSGVRVLMVGDGGSWLFLMAFAIVAAADIGAYFTGKSIGKRKLLPRVSPGKTVEGFAGGIICATLISIVGGLALNWPVPAAVIIGVTTGVASVIGDLTVSLFKRNAGLKDSGSVLPGHGGVLDRIDGVTAAMPLYTALLVVFNLLPAAVNL